MAVGIYFAVGGMTPEKFTTVHEQLAAIGQANPPVRTFHAGFEVGDGIHAARDRRVLAGLRRPRPRASQAAEDARAVAADPQIERWLDTASTCDCGSPEECIVFDGEAALTVVHVEGCRRSGGS
jgi:hypothetical protein